VAKKQPKILVVDDEFDIVFIVRKHLEKWGYSVDTFTDPTNAYKAFKNNPTNYSMAILDIRMPEMSGITLAAMIKKIKPDFKVVIMTAFEILAEDLEVSLPTINRDDILRKPFSMTEVCGSVKRHLQTA